MERPDWFTTEMNATLLTLAAREKGNAADYAKRLKNNKDGDMVDFLTFLVEDAEKNVAALNEILRNLGGVL